MHTTMIRMDGEYPSIRSTLRKLYSAISIHARMIYPPERLPNETHRRFRFIIRSLVYLPMTVRWLSFINCTPELCELARAIPHIAETWHRPYLHKDLGARRRLDILFGHYRFLLGHPCGTALVTAIVRQVPIATFSGKQGEQFFLYCDDHWGRKQEGEIVLKLTEGTVRVYTIAGTFLRIEDQTTLVLGCLQGPDRSQGNERVKIITKALHAMRPRDLMFYTMQLVAEAFGVDKIIGVSSAHHVYRSRTKTYNRVSPDYYDILWKEIGGTVRHDGDFELPLRTPDRPIEDYPSQRRAEARRRQALRSEIRNQLTGFLLAPGGAVESDYYGQEDSAR